MPNNANIFRIHNEATKIAEQNARMRELNARSIEVLAATKPDTFLGKKTQEPFPRDDEE